MKASFVLAAVALAVFLGAWPKPAVAAYKGGTKPMPFYQWPDEFMGSGGFMGPGIIPISVKQARVTQPESSVIVQGSIKQQVGYEQYVFEDGTSSILVTIPADAWSGQDITPGCLVKLHGEVRRSPDQVKISVAKVIKVQ